MSASASQPPDDRCSVDIAAARSGSEAALGSLFALCRPYLLEIARAELPADLQAKFGASDVVQESLLEAQRDFPGFAGASEAELRAWLRRIVVHNLANAIRQYRGVQKRAVGRELRQRDGAQPEPPSAEPSPSGGAIAGETAAALERALERLPDDYRQIIRSRYHEQLSFAAIAERMGRSLPAVRKLWARAVERLQAEMGPPHVSP